MEEIELLPNALREQAALRASTQRMRNERLQLETYAEKLEVLSNRAKESWPLDLQVE